MNELEVWRRRVVALYGVLESESIAATSQVSVVHMADHTPQRWAARVGFTAPQRNGVQAEGATPADAMNALVRGLENAVRAAHAQAAQRLATLEMALGDAV